MCIDVINCMCTTHNKSIMFKYIHFTHRTGPMFQQPWINTRFVKFMSEKKKQETRFNKCVVISFAGLHIVQTELQSSCIQTFVPFHSPTFYTIVTFNPLNPELNPICYLLALLGAHHFLHISRIRVKLLTFRLLMSYIYIYIYIYGAPILDVSRSHTTQHSR